MSTPLLYVGLDLPERAANLSRADRLTEVDSPYATPSGQSGITVTGGTGGGSLGVGGLVGPSVSNAHDLNELAGNFGNLAGSVGEGPFGVGGDFQFGYGSCGRRLIGVTGGWAPP